MSLSSALEKERLKKVGYVEIPGGPLCDNCKFITKKSRDHGFCSHPKIQAMVDLDDGCCNEWSSPDATVGAEDE